MKVNHGKNGTKPELLAEEKFSRWISCKHENTELINMHPDEKPDSIHECTCTHPHPHPHPHPTPTGPKLINEILNLEKICELARIGVTL